MISDGFWWWLLCCTRRTNRTRSVQAATVWYGASGRMVRRTRRRAVYIPRGTVVVVGARPMSLPLRRRRRRRRWRRVASERLYCSFRPRRPLIIASDRPVPSTRTMSSSYRTIVPRYPLAIYLARLPSITARAAVKDARRTAPTPCRRHVTRYALQSLLHIVVPAFRETVFRSIASERSRQCQSSR